MLVCNESYDQRYIVAKICTVIEDIHENYAASIFRDVMGPKGKAACSKYLLLSCSIA